MSKWADMTESQKEKARANHRKSYEKNRAARLAYQKKYRENMTPEQRERARLHHRRNYARARGDRLKHQKEFRERKRDSYGKNDNENVKIDTLSHTDKQ